MTTNPPKNSHSKTSICWRKATNSNELPIMNSRSTCVPRDSGMAKTLIPKDTPIYSPLEVTCFVLGKPSNWWSTWLWIEKKLAWIKEQLGNRTSKICVILQSRKELQLPVLRIKETEANIRVAAVHWTGGFHCWQTATMYSHEESKYLQNSTPP